MPFRGLTDGHLEHLGPDESWRLLGSHAFGRFCFCVDDRVQVVLAPYVAHGDRIYFRAATFGPVARRVLTRPVTLQVDDLRGDREAGWSVTATGTALLVEDAATLASLWSPVRPAPWGVGQESSWVQLTPDDVQGRRLA